MSTFKVEVVALPAFTKHPNADSLFLTNIYDYPVIFNTANGYKEGELVAYIPVDAVVPMTPEWAFLGDSPRSHRIKAKKLRGIFSMGLLVRAPEGSNVGDDVSERLGIVKYECPEPAFLGGENEKDPGFIPSYTDIENYRRYSHVLVEGEPVILTEKLHGCNGRFVYHSKTDRLWVGSRTCIKKEDPNNLWWKIADRLNFRERLKQIPDKVIYGEVIGQVQDLRYDAKTNEYFFRVFDVFDILTGRYLDFDAAQAVIKEIGLEPVPILHRGPWNRELLALCEGKSTLANHVREGFVVRPEKERYSNEAGRVIFKMIGEGYLLRKGETTEYH